MTAFSILNTTPTPTTRGQFEIALEEIADLEKLEAHVRDFVTVAVLNMQTYFGYRPSEKLTALLA